MRRALTKSLRDPIQIFLKRCQASVVDFALTPLAEASPYARCFAVFNAKLLGLALPESAALAQAIETDMRKARALASPQERKGKPYRQLLTFSLSALVALEALKPTMFADLVAEQIPGDFEQEVRELGCLKGVAGSGNQAMFLAIFLLHARDYLGMDTQAMIDLWVDLHIKHMNRFGFWGPDRGMTHLQFQNGYHQYEILDYLGVANPKEEAAVAAVRSLADSKGHFAPYPGGGGCYDYDAVFVLTPGHRTLDPKTKRLLEITAENIISEQRADGGFAESLYVRPRSLRHLVGFGASVLGAAGQGNAPLFIERLRYALTLQRPVHDRIKTHWSVYSRRWNEADLWDSWFRMMALARIEVAHDPSAAQDWGFINYPGIGYHACLRKTQEEIA